MITADQIAAALNLTGVTLSISPEGLATITAAEPVTAAQQALVHQWHLAGRIDQEATAWAAFLAGSITVGGIALKANIEARDAFTGQLILIREALAAGVLSQSSPISLWDATEQEHQMPVAQCRALLLGYGIAWQQAFAQLAP